MKMKLSVAIAAENADASAFVVWRGFEKSIEKASAYGYDGVELALKTAGEVDRNQLDRTLKRCGMEVSCISTGQVFSALHQYLTNQDEEQRLTAVETLSGLIVLAKDYGKMVNIGRVRGFYLPGEDKALAEERFVDSLRRLAEVAAKHDVTIIIEPVNRYETNFINSVEECAAFLRGADLPHVGIMPDVFHMNIEDAKIGESLVRHKELIQYVHLADSNRYAPGNAHMDFDEIFHALECSGYDGWVSVEIFPVPTPDDAARQAADHLLPYIHKHNQKMQGHSKEGKAVWE